MTDYGISHVEARTTMKPVIMKRQAQRIQCGSLLFLPSSSDDTLNVKS